MYVFLHDYLYSVSQNLKNVKYQTSYTLVSLAPRSYLQKYTKLLFNLYLEVVITIRYSRQK
ncbi:hypothetical protein CpB1113 [Chlamydia pneumoniae TW-183]|uniref:Uncharacterized protein n=1 Tax=Chlamydia pneumoniae TaxID=83558 RepID=A0ABN3YT80_CHLPN|nr:hypothetical protein CpB1113 [Chlamydia pneumoniae TW-183]